MDQVFFFCPPRVFYTNVNSYSLFVECSLVMLQREEAKRLRAEAKRLSTAALAVSRMGRVPVTGPLPYEMTMEEVCFCDRVFYIRISTATHYSCVFYTNVHSHS